MKRKGFEVISCRIVGAESQIYGELRRQARECMAGQYALWLDNNIKSAIAKLKPWRDMRPLRTDFPLLARGGSLKTQILGEKVSRSAAIRSYRKRRRGFSGGRKTRRTAPDDARHAGNRGLDVVD
jgi:hypothetical protein